MNSIKNLTKEYFEGLSQVLFFRNPLPGFILLILSLAFQPQIFVYGLVASLVGFGYSTQYRTPKILRTSGLLIINGFFFGIAMAALFKPSPQFYLCLALGAMALPLLTKASFEVLQHWKLTPLIIPYILAIWLISLSTGQFLHHNTDFAFHAPTFFPISIPISLPFLTPFPISFSISEYWVQLLMSTFVSMGQIFFYQNMEYGMCLFLLISAFSPRRGLFFFLGTFSATLIFSQLNGGQPGWYLGFLGYSAGLVGLGLASLPEKFTWRTILLFCVVSLFLTLALSRVLRGFSLPILSLPYVLTLWLALLSRVPRLNMNWAPPESI
jgi:urea transporter